jgi:hypothetical protein
MHSIASFSLHFDELASTADKKLQKYLEVSRKTPKFAA